MISSSSFVFIWHFIFRHPGLVLVLLGVVGEVICEWKITAGRLARTSAIVLVLGLTMEFIEAAQSDKEVEKLKLDVAQANERAAGFDKAKADVEKQVEEFRKANIELKIKLQPRTITAEQRERFVAVLKDSPKGAISLYAQAKDIETLQYRKEIREMLEAAGYSIKNTVPEDQVQNGTHEMWESTSKTASVFLGLVPESRNITTTPFMDDLKNAFSKIGVDTPWFGINSTAWKPSNSNLIIIVTEKR